jgi:glycosyltransferase involved in cell wall biosynthesis
MRVVIDGLPIRGMSLGIVVEHLLNGWDQLASGDELHLVVGPEADLNIPASVKVHRLEFGRRHSVSRLYAQSFTLPTMCRRLQADVLLGVLPTTSVSPLPCPRAIIAYDLRHELRPEQFSTRARLLRKVSYDLGFRQADAITCISERTRRDLLTRHPRLRSRLVGVSHLGADHVAAWPRTAAGERYAIAFGQYGNKNIDLVVDAWSLLHARGEVMPLVLVGLSDEARATVGSRICRLGLSGVVTALPWLPIESFRQRFASASLVVFPSDFEGFGLPAVEAMFLGIPVVITPDPALLEVTGGHATVMDGTDAEALATAVEVAQRTFGRDLEEAKSYAETFTWARTAEQVRSLLADAVSQSRKLQ